MKFPSLPALLRRSNAVVFALGATTLVATSAFAYSGRLYVFAQATGSCSTYPDVYAFAEARNYLNLPDCDTGVTVGSGSSVTGSGSCKFSSTPETVYAMAGTLDSSTNTRTIGVSSSGVAWGGGTTYVSGAPFLGSACTVSAFAWGQ